MQTFDGERTRPGDQRAFLHKKILRFASKVAGVAAQVGIPGAGFVSGITGRLAGRPTGPPLPAQVIPTTFASSKSFDAAVPGLLPLTIGGGGKGDRGMGFAGPNGPCPPRTIRSPEGNCIFPGSPRGAEVFGGNVIAGQYGAGYVAGSKLVDVAQCPRGTVLGKDGVCYANLSNKNRLYPRGRRPLLTGGDMRAISRAKTAGNRLANAKNDLIAIGMLKAAGPRKRRKKAPTVCP